MKLAVLIIAVIGAASATYIAPAFGGYSAYSAPVVSAYHAPAIVAAPLAYSAPAVAAYAGPAVGVAPIAPVVRSYAAPVVTAPVVPAVNSFGYTAGFHGGYVAPAFGVDARKKKAAA